jgi:hypothetical protein
VVVEELGRDVVLDDLVLEEAEVRLLHHQASELDRVLDTRDRERADDTVDSGVVVDGAKLLGGRAGAPDEPVQAVVASRNGNV